MNTPTCMKCEQDPDAPCRGFAGCHGYMAGCQCQDCLAKFADIEGRREMAEEQMRVIERVIQPRSYTKKTVIVKKVCPVCGETFEGVRQKRYCRLACSARADYQRHAAQRRKTRVKRYREEKRRSSYKIIINYLKAAFNRARIPNV